jgi:2'-5' RNA ligase
VPPESVSHRLDILRKELNEIAGSSYALQYPPHVTLRTGFLVPENKINSFIDEFGLLFSQQKTFRIETGGIHGGFYMQNNIRRPIVYFSIKPDQSLLSLNKRLLAYTQYRKSSRTHFDPHLSIAYRDLSMKGFERLKEIIENRSDLKKQQHRWVCDHAGLYVKNGESWQPFHIFMFQ